MLSNFAIYTERSCARQLEVFVGKDKARFTKAYDRVSDIYTFRQKDTAKTMVENDLKTKRDKDLLAIGNLTDEVP